MVPVEVGAAGQALQIGLSGPDVAYPEKHMIGGLTLLLFEMMMPEF